MNFRNPEFSPHSNAEEKLTFADTFRALLPGIEFEEPAALSKMRAVAPETLKRNSHDPDLIRAMWMRYDEICEQIVDNKSDTDPRIHAQLHIAT